MKWELKREARCCSTFIRRAVLGVSVFAICQVAVGAPQGYEILWQDDFKGNSLNLDSWTVGSQKRDDALQAAEAISVSDGTLRIRTYTTGGLHYTGFLSTAKRLSRSYGYFEARILFRGAPGEWCAFWLQSPSYGREVGSPSRSGVEVDIAEHRVSDKGGRDVGNWIAFNLHWDGYGRDHKQMGNLWRSPTPLNATWHTYAVLWTPDGFSFFVDNIQRWQSSAVVSDVPQDIRLTCEVRDDSWAGSIPKGGYGSRDLSLIGMDVDWVRVWHKP